MQWYKRWQSWRERHPYMSVAFTFLGLLITAPGMISDLKTWVELIQSVSRPKDWERWLFVIVGLTIVFIANDIPGKLVKKFGSRQKSKVNLAPVERTGLNFSKFSYVDRPYDEDKLRAALTGRPASERTYYITIENFGPNDLVGVSVSVSNIWRHPRNPGDEAIDRLENILRQHFYPLPFTDFRHNKNFPVGHQTDVLFVAYDWNINADSFIIGAKPGSFFAHLGRVHTITVQIMAMGHPAPLTNKFQVWVQDGKLKVADNSLVFA